MPRPLNVDWDFIQALWLQGFTPAVISEKTGVKASSMVSLAYRNGWPRMLARTKAELAKAPQASVVLQVAHCHAKAHADASNRSKHRLSRVVEAQIDALERETPVTYKQLQSTPKAHKATLRPLGSCLAKPPNSTAGMRRPTHRPHSISPRSTSAKPSQTAQPRSSTCQATIDRLDPRPLANCSCGSSSLSNFHSPV